MTSSSLVNAIISRLERAGYTRMTTPFRVASVEFAFTAALRGKGARALDLIIIIDAATGSFGDTDGGNVRNRVEALSRALDITHSRYTLSLIVAGAVLTKDADVLAETCRVLMVPALHLGPDGQPVSLEMAEQLDDQLRVLLPLDLPRAEASTDGVIDPINTLLEALPSDIDAVLVHEIVGASSRGEMAISEALGKRVDDVLGELEADE